MFIPIAFAQVNFKFTGAGLPRGAEVTLGLSNGSLHDPEAIANNVFTVVDSLNTESQFGSGATMSSIYVKCGPNSTGRFAEKPCAFVGTLSGPMGAPQVAALLKVNTSTGGRHGYGRRFWPGLTENVVGPGGVIDSSYATGLTTWWGNLTSGLLSTYGYAPYLFHNDPVVAASAIHDITCQSQCATMRRRNRR